jgi:uncharacterized membrane protein YccC
VASSAEPTAVRRAWPRLPSLPWPEGTTWFAFRTWVALCLALYAAFVLELTGASSAGVCVLILAQPAQGMVLSKAIYRFTGTIVGVGVALILIALFPQDRVMLLACFAIFMALQTALGTLLRDFRAYGCILAGYTVAIVAIANIDTPLAAFDSAINRVAAIVLGIVVIALTNTILATAESTRSLSSKLRLATRDLRDLMQRAIDERARPNALTCVEMSARLMPLRSEISFASPELPNGRARAKGARSALLGLFEMISAAQQIGVGLSRLEATSPIVEEAVAILEKALRLQRPERCVPDLEALALPAIGSGTLTMNEAFLLDRIHFAIDTWAYVRDGLLALRTGRTPIRLAAIPVHEDWFAVALNAVRVATSVGIVAILSVWTGLSDTAQAVLFTAVFVSLGSIQPNPGVMGKAALIGMPAVGLAAALYVFFIFPLIDGFPLFALSLLPLVVAMCWFIKCGQPGAGLIFGVQTLVLMSPANVQTLDPQAFVATAVMLAVSGVSIFLSFLLILPVDPAQRRLRIALGVGRALRNALKDEGRLDQPRASLHYDRLAQFRTWQGSAIATLARRKTMERLVDLGNLSLAIRRAWRAIERARASVDPDLDRQARQILPTLSPDETNQIAERYLAAAKGAEGQSALQLVRAAAALFGTALVTRKELRVLRRANLVRRPIGGLA